MATARIRSASSHQRRTRNRLRLESTRLVRKRIEGKTTFLGSRRAIKCSTTGTVIAAKPNSRVAFRNVTVRRSYRQCVEVKWNRLWRCFQRLIVRDTACVNLPVVHRIARGGSIDGLLKTTLPLNQVFGKRFVEGHACVEWNIVDSQIVTAFTIRISKRFDLLQVVIPEPCGVHGNCFATL